MAPVPFDAFDPAVAALPAERKIELALELERMVRGGDPRITGVRIASFCDSSGRFAVATNTGIAGAGRGAWCSMGVLALADDGDETYTGNGSTVGFSPDDLDLDEAAGDAVLRCTRLFGATAVPSQRLTVVLEPRLAASVVGLLGGTLTGERVLKGRSPFADRMGETIASPLLDARRRPHRPPLLRRRHLRRRGPGLSPQRARRRRRAPGLPARQRTGPSGGHGRPPGSAVRGISSTPSVGCQALAVAPGSGTLDELAGLGRPRASSCSR